jgi:hypothetical protein
MMTAAVTVLAAAPLLAQEKGAGGQETTGYVTGLGGFAASVGNTTGDMLAVSHLSPVTLVNRRPKGAVRPSGHCGAARCHLATADRVPVGICTGKT